MPDTGSALIARSPIRPAEPVTAVAGWEVSGARATSPLTITDLTPLAKVLVRAGWDGPAAAALGVPHGRAARNSSGALVTGSGPGEWLVLAPPGTAAEAAARLQHAAGGAELVTVLEVTHGLAVIRITGERSADLLAKLCAVDLGDRVTPDGSALRSSVARLAAGVVRDDQGRDDQGRDGRDRDGQDRDDQDRDGPAGRSYLLHCDRSYGQYLFGAVADAGREFGIEVDGFRLPGI